jgi:hypothetical protein
MYQKLTKNQFLKVTICLLITMFMLFSCNYSSKKKEVNSTEIKKDSIADLVTENDTIDVIVKSIIEISAKDFYKNQNPLPTEFRNVQLKYSIKPNKEILYILCGQFSNQENQKNTEWIQFTTIKNSAYEQWIGPNGLTYCENSKEIPYKKVELTLELKNKLNQLMKNKL